MRFLCVHPTCDKMGGSVSRCSLFAQDGSILNANIKTKQTHDVDTPGIYPNAMEVRFPACVWGFELRLFKLNPQT